MSARRGAALRALADAWPDLVGVTPVDRVLEALVVHQRARSLRAKPRERRLDEIAFYPPHDKREKSAAHKTVQKRATSMNKKTAQKNHARLSAASPLRVADVLALQGVATAALDDALDLLETATDHSDDDEIVAAARVVAALRGIARTCGNASCDLD